MRIFLACLCLMFAVVTADAKPYCYTAIKGMSVDMGFQCYNTRKEAAQARRTFLREVHRDRIRSERIRSMGVGPQTNDSGRYVYGGGEGANVMAWADATPGRFIRGRLTCAINVGIALAERGLKGTGSALAKSYLRWGAHSPVPVPGAIAVYHRRGGGHVAIVKEVRPDGRVVVINPGRRGWQVVVYHKRAIQYRVPS